MKIFVSSVMWETWEERNVAKDLLEEYGHVSILKANYENGPQAGRETVYHTDSTRILIESSECFLMIPKFTYGLTTASGYSIAHEELLLARKMRKQGIVFGPPNGKIEDAEKAQEQLLIELSAYLGNSYIAYEDVNEFRDRLKDVLQNRIDKYTTPLRPNKVFLSHTSVDKGFVENLASDLLRYGFEVWYDKYDISVGDSLLKTIKSGVENSAYIVLVLSPESVKSDWVRKEIDLALELERHWGMKVLLPVKCRHFEWPQELEHLKELKFADFTGQRHLALMDLISTLKQ